MGGDYEDTIEASAPKRSFSGGVVATSDDDETVVSGIRFHTSKGKVHFHDDKQGLKCYVPVAQWWSAWQKLRVPKGGTENYQYHDIDNEALLTVESQMNGDAVTVRMAVTPQSASLGPQTFDRVWHALDNFTNKAS